jgi:prevent-host-death family protein
LAYNRDVKYRQISATELKAKCLALLDEVNKNGETIIITKRGKPVAMLQASKKVPGKSLENAFSDQIKIVGDIVNFNTAEDWEAFQPAAPTPKRRRRAA